VNSLFNNLSFASVAPKKGIEIPKIHLIVGNRLTQYEGPAKAYSALSRATTNTLFQEYVNNPSRFTEAPSVINNSENFRDFFSVPLRDFNTAGIVSAHLGTPLSKLQQKKYDINGSDVMITKARIQECELAIDKLLEKL
jgi:hypothetical protein